MYHPPSKEQVVKEKEKNEQIKKNEHMYHPPSKEQVVKEKARKQGRVGR